MEENKEYYAFISYKREDEKWAKWLQHKLEHYKFPTNLNGRTDLPKHIQPTFRDVTDLNPGLLAEEINNALCNSEWLIVICSPRSAKSPWVCKEVQTFIDLGRADHIIPFAIEGNPFSNDFATECYPQALLNLTGSKELLAANINEMGRDAAAIKVVARMFNLRFDTLWQRHEREQRRKRWFIIAGTLLFALVSLGIGGYIAKQNHKLDLKNKEVEEERDRANSERDKAEAANASLMAANDSIQRQYKLIERQKNEIALERDNVVKANWKMKENLARFVAQNANKLINTGETYLANRIAIEILPKDIHNPDFPYTSEAERLLRTVARYGNQTIRPVEHGVLESFPNQALFSPNNQYIAYSYDDEIFIWDIYHGVIIDTFDIQTRNGYNYIDLEYSSDGKWLKGSDDYNNVKIWSVDSKESVDIDDLDSSIVFNRKKYNTSNDKKYDIYIIDDFSFRLRNINTGELSKNVFIGHSDDIICSAFTPDGKYVLTGSRDATIRMWNLETSECVKVFTGHYETIVSIDISPNNKYMVSTSTDNSVRLWTLIPENAVFFNKRFIIDIKSFHNDIYVASYDKTNKTLYIDDINDDSIITITKYATSKGTGMSAVCISPNLESIVVTNEEGGKYSTYVVDIKTCDTIVFCDCQYPIEKNFFTNDGDRIVSISYYGDIIIWNAKNGKCEKVWKISNQYKDYNMGCASISPDGRYIAINDYRDNFVQIYTINGIKKQSLIGHSDHINSISFSKDGKYIVTSSQDHSIRMWNINTGMFIKTFSGHTDFVFNAVFNPTGDYILSTSLDMTSRVWNVKDGECIETINSNERKDVVYYGGHPMAFSQDGRKVIVADDYDGNIRVLDFLPLQELIDEIRKRFKDTPLTSEERRQYYLE